MSGECQKCGEHALECDCILMEVNRHRYIGPMEWISVKDKVPENKEDVLVYNPKDGIGIGEFDIKFVQGYLESDGSYQSTNSGWETEYAWAPYSSPTHWMPLPPPPKTEGL